MKGIRPKSIFRMILTAGKRWMGSNVFRLSASLSYFTVFSLAPLLVVALFVVGVFWGDQSFDAQAQIINQIDGLIGPEGATMVETMLSNAERPGTGGIMTTVVGIGALLFGATVVFAQLKGALNAIWDVKETASGFKGFLRTRVLSFGLVIVVGFLLLVSLILSAALAALDEFVTSIATGFIILIHILNLVLSFGVVTVLFAMIYRYLPDIRIAWRDVWVGAAITALLFSLGKLGIGLYLGHSSVTSTYGAAGSLVVLLLWVYYSSMIMLFGAELTQVYVQRYGIRSPFETIDRPASQGRASLLYQAPPSDEWSNRHKKASPDPSLAGQIGLFIAGIILGRYIKHIITSDRED